MSVGLSLPMLSTGSAKKRWHERGQRRKNESRIEAVFIL
jgi:hypothetical protein